MLNKEHMTLINLVVLSDQQSALMVKSSTYCSLMETVKILFSIEKQADFCLYISSVIVLTNCLFLHTKSDTNLF